MSETSFDNAESEPSTVWSIPEFFVEDEKDSESRFSTSIPHDEANRLVAEALRQAAEAAARVDNTVSTAGRTADPQGWSGNGFDSHQMPQSSAEQFAHSWQLLFLDGSSVRFGRQALVGRQAIADERWPDAELVSIADPTASMSKNHVRLETDELGIVIIDLFSLNGTVLTTDDGTTIDLFDGQRTRLSSGARITLGDFIARLERV